MIELPNRALEWVVDSVCPGAKVTSVSRLLGGTSSLIHSITLQTGQEEADYVLRLINNEEWLQEEPDAAWHEAESLLFASDSGLPAPQLVACDQSGEACGMPAVLMTKISGSVVLRPENPDRWLGGLADTLTRIHAVPADGFAWQYAAYIDLETLEAPEWSGLSSEWTRAIAYARDRRPAAKTCFIHRDYHPANVLWTGGSVSGVVDWINGCRGPAGIDVGQCRSDLAQLYDVATADAFLSAYEAAAGKTFAYDPYWDLVALIDTLFGPPAVFSGWKALGVTGLTDGMMAERVDAYMLSLLKRI
ncbi:phosphotransferase family protein [Paenibacillus oceani]|uniref:Aminoglycoside phosphotransferase family protein n=1 Tax=Paenibacillus oceani TaxID=2772510 RepID=A0A927C9G9_9BACL|nr:aminoglycoside phosphotransferase family protein [Paenibacillus oceani]MBD2863878.1 aminoglycoside phosphotransferase family protein [Paenibacillus oceani]